MKGAIWGYDYETAEAKLLEIEQNYIRMNIKPQKRVISRSSGSWILFENGDKWKIVRASDSARGHSLNVSYIDTRIPHEFIECVIKPCTKSLPYQAIHYFHPPIFWSEEENEED